MKSLENDVAPLPWDDFAVDVRRSNDTQAYSRSPGQNWEGFLLSPVVWTCLLNRALRNSASSVTW